jgi:hypothetical protein
MKGKSKKSAIMAAIKASPTKAIKVLPQAAILLGAVSFFAALTAVFQRISFREKQKLLNRILDKVTTAKEFNRSSDEETMGAFKIAMAYLADDEEGKDKLLDKLKKKFPKVFEKFEKEYNKILKHWGDNKTKKENNMKGENQESATISPILKKIKASVSEALEVLPQAAVSLEAIPFFAAFVAVFQHIFTDEKRELLKRIFDEVAKAGEFTKSSAKEVVNALRVAVVYLIVDEKERDKLLNEIRKEIPRVLRKFEKEYDQILRSWKNSK